MCWKYYINILKIATRFKFVFLLTCDSILCLKNKQSNTTGICSKEENWESKRINTNLLQEEFEQLLGGSVLLLKLCLTTI